MRRNLKHWHETRLADFGIGLEPEIDMYSEDLMSRRTNVFSKKRLAPMRGRNKLELRSHAIPMIVYVICTVLVAAFVTACHADTKSPYPVTSSGLLFGGGNLGAYAQIYWLDNQRVLFPGFEVRHKAGPDGKDQVSTSPPGIYIWDTKTNTFKRHADLAPFPGSMCFYHGFIVYAVGGDWEHHQFDMRGGVLGEEKKLIVNADGDYGELDQCQGWPRLSYQKEVDQMVDELRPGDGYILISHGSGSSGWDANLQNKPVSLVQPGRPKPIVLPILAKEMFTDKLSYSDYAHKYVLIPHTWRAHDVTKIGTWPKDEPIPIYLIAPDGKVETIHIPYGTYTPMGVFPTRRGLFWISNETSHASSKEAGGWLLEDGKVTKLFDQLVNGAGVSPDGCKIAYANDAHAYNAMVIVQVIDLCGRKKGE